MNKMNIARVDLNLFVVFEAIYSEGSISRAANRLSLTQPAVSHALGRLRQRLDDPLFVRRGNQMVPTPRARALVEPVRESLQGLQQCLSGEQRFDPASARRTFVLGLRDGVEACVLPALIAHLAKHAPNVEIQSATVPRRDIARELAAGRLDMAIDVQLSTVAQVQQRALMASPLMVLMRKRHPLTRTWAAKGGPSSAVVTLEQYLQARHALVSSRRRGPGLEDFGLAQLGYSRELGLRCQHYQSALEVVAQSDLLLTLPKMLADRLADKRRFVVATLPLTLPSLGLYMYWHRDHEGDAAHQWLRELFARELQE